MKTRATTGFTLLEIVVALAIFGLLLVGLSQTVRFGLTAWRQQARLSEGNSDLEAVDRTVRSIIENLTVGHDAAQPAIIGSADSLTGLTMLRFPGAGSTPTRIEAGLAVSGTRLVLRWRPYHHGDPLNPPPPPQETELIGGIARLRIAYWQPPGVWTSTWKDPELPLLIRINLTFLGDAAHWPEIVAAPLLSPP